MQKVTITRRGCYPEKVVFVDGLWGCGKTMLSPIIASLDRVELLSYSYEIEYLCSLDYLGKITPDASDSMINMLTDLKTYNTMMGRDVNFRPSDLSSATRDPFPERYTSRLTGPGDEQIPDIIKSSRPILHLATHNLIPFSRPLFSALKERAVIVEVVRHPLYMIKQQALNMENLIGDERDFTIYYELGDKRYPYYVKGWENEFNQANSIEKAILYIHKLNSLRSEVSNSQILTIPFEHFVLEPDSFIKKIEKLLGSKATQRTNEIMRLQNVPRLKVGAGIDLDIYKRCGWQPPSNDSTEKEELSIRYEFVKQNASRKYLELMEQEISNYELKYWSPK